MLPDVSVAGAAIAGLLSFLSPCILPIVSFYLDYMVGVSMNQIDADGGLTRAVRIRPVLAAVLMTAAGVGSVGQAACSAWLRRPTRSVARRDRMNGCQWSHMR